MIFIITLILPMYAKHEYTTKRQRQPPSIAHTEIDFIIKQTKIISVIIVFFFIYFPHFCVMENLKVVGAAHLWQQFAID